MADGAARAGVKGISVDFTEPAPVEAGAGLVAHVLPGRSARLVVALAGVGSARGGVPPIEFLGTASDWGENHALFVSDPARSWLNGPGVASAMVALIEEYRARHGIEELVLLGNSMGGFSALVLADLMPVDTVIAFSPQFSMHRDLVPEETRWQFHAERIGQWPHRDVGSLAQAGTRYYIFHGGAPCEARHWRRFPAHAGLNHLILHGQGHNVAPVMRKRRVLDQVVRLAMENRPWVLYRRLRRSTFGRRFPPFRREDYDRDFPDSAA